MNFLTKLRPGSFGLLIIALVLSTFARSVFKSTAAIPRTSQDLQGNVSQGAITSSEERGDELDEALTYFQYQIDLELENLVRQIRSEARAGLDEGMTVEQIDTALYDLSKSQSSAATTAQRLVLLRQLQTLQDGEAMPQVEAIVNPTVEDYRNEISKE